MLGKRSLALVTVALVVAACAEPPIAVEKAAPEGSFALVGVSVVPMDREEVLADQTVLVEGDRITALGPASEVEVPETAMRIDGKGRWVLPGLYDLHVHQEEPEELLFYLASGVTTILHLSGSPEKLEERAALAAGEVKGPRMFTCGPTLHGNRIEAESVAAVVTEIAEAGYDCVKIYNDWTPEAYAVASETAATADLAFMGHAPRNLPFDVVLEEGRQQIVHLEEIVYTTEALDSWLDLFREGAELGPGNAPDVLLADTVDEVARRLVERDMWVIATEIVIDNYLERATDEGLAGLATRPYLRYRDPVGRRRWARGEQKSRHARFAAQVALQHYMLRVFREHGVKMAAGTDAAVGSSLSVMPGWSLHEELAIMGSVGFTPYEALRLATVDAAAYLGLEGEGTVRAGGRADLLVVDGDPLADLSAAHRPAAVVAAGRWTSQAELDRALEELAASFEPLEAEISRIDTALETGGPAEWIAALGELEEISEDVAAFVESEVNSRGYELLGDGKIDEAIDVLTLNTETFPASANTWDSLAEAWLEAGDRDRSIALYRKALEVDPEFSNAARMLERLGVEQ